jgi:hypothetical protein
MPSRSQKETKISNNCQRPVKPLDFPSPTQLENKKKPGCSRMPLSFFAVAYLSPHISINIVELSGPPTL